MSAPVEFHRLALTELKAAKLWYRERSATVAERLIEQVEIAVARIAEIRSRCLKWGAAIGESSCDISRNSLCFEFSQTVPRG